MQPPRITTILPTTKNITTAKHTTRPSTTTTLSTTHITETSSTTSTNGVLTKTDQFVTSTSKISKPTTPTTMITKTSGTEQYSSTHEPTQEPSITESQSTARVTTKKPTTVTTVLPPSTTPATTTVTTHRPGPSVCSKGDAKDVLFIIDGTINYSQYLKIRRKEWNQIKDFVKEIVSELNDDNNRIGIMQYGGRRGPRMEVDFQERADTSDLITKIHNIRQIGGMERKTGESLVIAGNKVSQICDDSFCYIRFYSPLVS